MKHEVFWITGDQVNRGDTDGHGHDIRGLGGFANMALEIREAYDQTAKNGGRIIAAHTMAYRLKANEDDLYHQDESEGECLFIVAEVPDDSKMGESDTEYVSRT